MMRQWALLWATVALLGCEGQSRAPESTVADAHPPATAQQPVPMEQAGMSMKIRPLIMNFQAKAESCSVSVWFSSIGTGIDIVTRRRIEALLEQDPAVVEVQPYLRGREGETELCIRVEDGGDIDRLFGALKAVASNGYLVGMRTEGGGEFQSTGNSKPK